MGRRALTSDTEKEEPTPEPEKESEGRSGWASLARGVLGILVFLTAIRLLGEVSGAVSEDLAAVLSALDDRPLSALGLGWLSTYLLTNGSVVAALGVTLTGESSGDPTLTFALVSGSRLGAAAFVVMVGVLDHLRRRKSLRSGVGLGMLAFVVSHALYVPATILSWTSLSFVVPPLARLTSQFDPAFLQPGLVDAIVAYLVDTLGPVFASAVGVGGLFLGVVLFDRALRAVDLDRIRERISLRRRWASFLAGLILTGLASSIAFSIGVLVPLFNRNAVSRREIAPYVLGANVTTLVDTYVVSLVLGSWEAGGAILGLMLIALVLSLGIMMAYGTFFRILDRVLDTISATRLSFVLFVVSLVVAPILLVVVGGWL
ncbi:MAG: hypothetical protein ACOC8K_03170 [Gemmatimonadota bacterium]